MSPDPDTVSRPPACVNPWAEADSARSMVPWRSWPVHRAAGQAPCRLTWSKVPVARVGPPVEDPPPSDVDVHRVPGRGGEQPGLRGGRQPGQRGRADPGPVRAVGGVVAGDRVAGPGQPQPARRGRGHLPGQAGHVVGEVPLHPHAVASGDHHRRVRRTLAGARLDDDPGLGPRLHARASCPPSAIRRRRRATPWVEYRPVSDVTRTVMLPFAGQRLADEVEAVGHPFPAGPGGRRRAGQAAGSVGRQSGCRTRCSLR